MAELKLIQHPRCPFCHDDVVPGSGVPKIVCEGCHAFHHAECWEEGAGCSAGRCRSMVPVPVRLAPATVPRRPEPASPPPAMAGVVRPDTIYLLGGPDELGAWVRGLPTPGLCVYAGEDMHQLLRSTLGELPQSS